MQADDGDFHDAEGRKGEMGKGKGEGKGRVEGRGRECNNAHDPFHDFPPYTLLLFLL